MKTKQIYIVAIFLTFIFIFGSCQKDEFQLELNNSNSSDLMGNLIIPENFDFSTDKEIKLNIFLPQSILITDQKSLIEIYSVKNGKQAGLLLKAAADKTGQFKTRLIMPSSENEIMIKTDAGSRNLNLKTGQFKSFGEDYIIDFGSNYSNQAPDTIKYDGGLKSMKNSIQIMNYGFKDLTNIIGNGNFEVDDFGYVNTWESTIPVDAGWYFTDHLIQGDNVTLIDYGGNNVVRINKQNDKFFGGISQNIDAEEGDIITFSADFRRVGLGFAVPNFYLIPRDSNEDPIKFISVYSLYPDSNWDTMTVSAVMPEGTETCQILLWSSQINCGSLEYDNVDVTREEPEDDSDGDGVDDDDDDYPDDPDKAFDVYYPDKDVYGTLAYEDLWPGKGDYDFNDLVVDYNYKHITNSDNEVVELEPKFKIRAFGASFHNGFAFELNMPYSWVSSVENNYNFTDNIFSFNPNGTEAGQSNAVIIVFEDSYDILNYPGSGIGINTDPNAPYVEPVIVELKITFSQYKPIGEMGSSPYNPFLVVNNERGKEVHLPGCLPTDLADISYFGMYADDTQPSINKYYLTTANLPWGLHIPVSLDYVIERVDINLAHYKFKEWVESGGILYPDWYEDNPGYRNELNIY